MHHKKMPNHKNAIMAFQHYTEIHLRFVYMIDTQIQN